DLPRQRLAAAALDADVVARGAAVAELLAKHGAGFLEVLRRDEVRDAPADQLLDRHPDGLRGGRVGIGDHLVEVGGKNKVAALLETAAIARLACGPGRRRSLECSGDIVDLGNA